MPVRRNENNTHVAPDRVVIDKEGTSVSLQKAQASNQLSGPGSVMLVRDDGWVLGAPKKFADVAHDMWPDKWTGFCVFPSCEIFPIERWGERESLSMEKLQSFRDTKRVSVGKMVWGRNTEEARNLSGEEESHIKSMLASFMSDGFCGVEEAYAESKEDGGFMCPPTISHINIGDDSKPDVEIISIDRGESKEDFMERSHSLAITRDTELAVFCCESFGVFLDADEHEASYIAEQIELMNKGKLRPSEHPDRKDVLLVVGQHRTGLTGICLWFMQDDGFGGKIFELASHAGCGVASIDKKGALQVGGGMADLLGITSYGE